MTTRDQKPKTMNLFPDQKPVECLGTRLAACGSSVRKRWTSGCGAAVAQKSTKTVSRNDGEKDMSDVNLCRIKGDTVQELESGQSSWDKAKSLSTRNFEES